MAPMLRAPLILLGATMVTAGLLAPYLGTGTAPGAPAAGHEQPERFAAFASASTSADKEAWLTGETVLERDGDGHFYADASVDSRKGRFLVDTGASVVALTGADATAMGIDWNEADAETVGRGASGDVRGIRVVLDTVELGDFAAHDVEAVVVPEGLDVSLLGQSFLSRLRGVRIDGDRMVLG